MSRQREIAALQQEIEKKERQLYRANLEMTAWNKGKYNRHSNIKMSKLLVESLRKAVADLQVKLHELAKEES